MSNPILNLNVLKDKYNQPILPKGVYVAEIVHCQKGKHPTQGHTTVRVDLEILSPPYAGQKLTKWFNLTSKAATDHLKQEFGSCGVVVNNDADLDEACTAMIGKIVNLDVSPDQGGSCRKVITGLSDFVKTAEVPTDIWG